MTQKITILAAMLGLTFTLAIGCGSRQEAEPVQTAETQGYEEPAPAPEPEPEPAMEDPDDVHLEGDRITIDQRIHFALGSDEILSDSDEILDHLAQFLRNHESDVPGLQVIGHTDRQGGAAQNQELSERRAAAVVAALQSRGVTQNLEAIGRGQTVRLCTENTDECHQRNRRVEFLVAGN